MSTRDEVSLSARERAALASLEAKAAAEDPQLGSAQRLEPAVGRIGPARVVGIVTSGWRAWLSHELVGFPHGCRRAGADRLSISAGLVVGLVGAALAAAGLRLGFPRPTTGGGVPGHPGLTPIRRA